MTKPDASVSLAVAGGAFLLVPVGSAPFAAPEGFSEEQRQMARTVLDFARERVRKAGPDFERDKLATNVALLREAGELGFLMIDVPEAYGGLGLDKVTSCIVSENLAHGNASFAVSYGAHAGIGTLPIVFFGTEAQKRTYLPDLASGKRLACYALTEPGSGSDALGAKATAVLEPAGRHYRLSGTKQWTSNSGFADVAIVFAKVDGDKFSAFIVDMKEAPGVSTGAEEKKMGLQGSSTRQLVLEDARVPAENLLGEVGKGHLIAFNALNIGRLKLAAGCIGGAKAVLEASAEYAKNRTAFGRAIAEFGAIRKKLAEMAAAAFAIETVVYRTAGLFDASLAGLDASAADAGRQAVRALEEYAIEASITKVYGSEQLDFVVDEGVQIHGGYGYMREYMVEEAYRDSRINRIFEGTNEINRLLIPDRLLRQATKGELPLMAALGELPGRIGRAAAAPQPPADDLLAWGRYGVEGAKLLALAAAGRAIEKYMTRLEREQQVAMAIGDLVIDLYVLDSVVGRVAQREAAKGDVDPLARTIMGVLLEPALDRIEAAARALLKDADPAGFEATWKGLWRLVRRPPASGFALREAVAAAVLDRGGYPL